MGGSASTRRVTIVNETNPDIISISDDVVQRLNSAPSTPSTPSSPRRQPPTSAAPAVYPSYSEMSGRSHQAEMDKLDHEWRARLEDLTRQNQQLYKLATDKFNGAVTEVNSQYVGHCTKPVCENTQSAVLDCYKKNVKQPLQCSREVAAFQNCVSATRSHLGATAK